MNKYKINLAMIILLLLTSSGLFADRFAPVEPTEDGSRNPNTPSIGDGTEGADVPIKNDNLLKGAEFVDEVSGALSVRYTDLSYPGEGNVHLKLDRVFNLGIRGQLRNPYYISSFWAYDLPLISDKTFSPSPGISYDIEDGLIAVVVGSLNKSVSAGNIIIIENNVNPISEGGKTYYEGSRTLYIPQSKSIIKIGYLKFHEGIAEWNNKFYTRLDEMRDIEIITAEGLVYEMTNRGMYMNDESYGYVKAITDINKVNKITFNYEVANYETSDRVRDVFNNKTKGGEYSVRYKRLSSIQDSKGRVFTFQYNNNINFHDRIEMGDHNTNIKHDIGETRDYISGITLNGKTLIQYNIFRVKHRENQYYSGNISNRQENAIDYYVELDSTTKSPGSAVKNNTIKYVYNYDYSDRYFYPSQLSLLYPKGGASSYWFNRDGKTTQNILKTNQNILNNYKNSKIVQYEYKTEVKQSSDYLDVNKNYGKTEILTGYYSNNRIIKNDKKEVYYEYYDDEESSGDEPKNVKGVILSLISEYKGSSGSIDNYKVKDIVKNTIKEISKDYYLPIRTINYTGLGKIKNEQTVSYDIYGNSKIVNNYTRSVEDNNATLYHTSSSFKYLYEIGQNAAIWLSNEVYSETKARETFEMASKYPHDLVITPNKFLATNKVIEALNSITIKPGFSINNMIFHARIVPFSSIYGSSNNTTAQLPLSFNAVVENSVSDIINNKSKKLIYEYDDALNKTKESVMKLDESGISQLLSTSYRYDSKNRLIEITNANNDITEIKHEKVLDRTIVSTLLTYNNSTITQTKEYDNKGRLIKESITDSLLTPEKQLYPISYTYDDLDRLLTTEQNGQIISKVTYDRDIGKNTVEVQDIEGNYIYKEYDGLNRVIIEETCLPKNPSISRIDDGTNRTNSIVTSSKNTYYHPVFSDKVSTQILNDISGLNRIPKITITNEYDKLGRVLSTKKNNITISKNHYHDEDNFVISLAYLTTDPIPNRRLSYTKTAYNWLGGITDVYQSEEVLEEAIQLDNSKNHTKYIYDSFGNNTNISFAYGTPDQLDYIYKYNNLDQLTEIVYPEGTKEKFEYDNIGQLIKTFDRIGNYSVVEYNNLKLPKTSINYDSFGSKQGSVDFSYNAQGNPNLIIEKNELGTITNEYSYMYDQFGYLINENKVIHNGTEQEVFNIDRTYDKLGALNRLLFVKDNYSKEINYIQPYNSAATVPENKIRLNDELGNNIISYAYNSWGALENIAFGELLTTRYSDYDSMLRPQAIITKNSLGIELLNLKYSYDLQGNVLQYSDNSNINTYTYDGLNRIVTENDYTYSYDFLNNRKELYVGGSSFPQLSKTYVYNSVNTNKMMLDEIIDSADILENVDYTYDANGNIIEKIKGSITWTYIYNTLNQLVEVKKNNITIALYRYDFNGHRIYKKENGTETYYVYDGNSILYEESHNVSTPLVKEREFNIIFNGDNIGKYLNDDLQYHLLDQLGSRKLTTDISGTVLSSSDVNYSAFGNLLAGNNLNYNFTGKQLDANTGLVYFNARFYDPEVGRFISQDPIKDGLNWYVYCENNPLKYIDPTGLYPNMRSVSPNGTEMNPWLNMKNWFAKTFGIQYDRGHELGDQKWIATEKLFMIGFNNQIDETKNGTFIQGGFAIVNFYNTETQESFFRMYGVHTTSSKGLVCSIGADESISVYDMYIPRNWDNDKVADSFTKYFTSYSFSIGSLSLGKTLGTDSEGERTASYNYTWDATTFGYSKGLSLPLSLSKTTTYYEEIRF